MQYKSANNQTAPKIPNFFSNNKTGVEVALELSASTRKRVEIISKVFFFYAAVLRNAELNKIIKYKLNKIK